MSFRNDIFFLIPAPDPNPLLLPNKQFKLNPHLIRPLFQPMQGGINLSTFWSTKSYQPSYPIGDRYKWIQKNMPLYVHILPKKAGNKMNNISKSFRYHWHNSKTNDHLPVQYIAQPRGSGDQNVPHSYCRWNSGSSEEVYKACKYRNI